MTPNALDMTREEWAANAERSVRLSCYPHERIPAGHPVYSWPQEAASLGRNLAAQTRAALTARLHEATGRQAGDIRSRRLALGRYARAEEWDEVARTVFYALANELADTDTAALAHGLRSLETMTRDRDSSIQALAEQLTRAAVEREVARRSTDEGWQRELRRREEIRAYLHGSRRITR